MSDVDKQRLKRIMWYALALGVCVLVLKALPPATEQHTLTFSERQQQKKIKQNNEWRASVCKDLGC